MLLSVLNVVLKNWVGALANMLAPTFETIPVGVGHVNAYSRSTHELECRGRSMHREASWIAAKRNHSLPLEEECPALFVNWQYSRTH